MTGWNFDMASAPRGSCRVERRRIGKNEVDVEVFTAPPIIAAGSGGVVTLSCWLPKEGRWNMFTKDTPPVAWMPWPAHPAAEPSKPSVFG